MWHKLGQEFKLERRQGLIPDSELTENGMNIIGKQESELWQPVENL